MGELGNIFGDALDDVEGAVSDVSDLVSGAVSDVPGLSDAFAFAGENLQDFANTTFGQTVLRAFVTVYAYPALATTLGPQIAAVSFAAPGLAKGDDFDQAWCAEFMYRLQKTAEVLGGDAAAKVSAQFQPAIDSLTEAAKNAGIDPQAYAQQLETQGGASLQTLARSLGVRPDMLQTAIDYLAKQSGFARTEEEAQAIASSLEAFGAHVDASSLLTSGLQFDPATGNVIGLAQAQTRAAAPIVNVNPFLAFSLVRKPIASTVSVAAKAPASLAAKSVFSSAPKQPVVQAPAVAPHMTDSHPFAAPVPASSSAAKVVGVAGGVVAAGVVLAFLF